MQKTNNVLDPIFPVWFALQHGQEKIVRFGPFHDEFPHKLRKQNGHEHRCSVGFLFMVAMIKIRSYVLLDELLLTRCIELHDVPEGITGIDRPSPSKKAKHDLHEYLVFRDLYKPLGREIWLEARRCYLLQFALTRPTCFPHDARKVMDELHAKNYHEASFFDGVQRLDYLYYAYECHRKHRVTAVIKDVSRNHFVHLEQIAKSLPGFRQTIWTYELSQFFGKFC